MRNVWCKYVGPSQVVAFHPKGYTKVEDGREKVPGTFGNGFGGEAVICLLDGDDGFWFAAYTMGCPAGYGCQHLPKEAKL